MSSQIPASLSAAPGTDPVFVSYPARLLLGAGMLAYLVLTVLLFYFGPWLYPMDAGRGRLLVFLIAVHLAFGIGYLLGIRGRPRPSRWPVRLGPVVFACVAVELLLLFPTSLQYTGAWIPNPWAAVQDLGAAYTRSLALRDAGTAYSNYVRILFAPLLFASVPLAVFYWRHLSGLTRTLFVITVLGTLALYTAMGANAGAAQWMMLFPWFVLAAHCSGVQTLTMRGWSKAVAVQIASVLVFVVMFSATMNQRRGSFAKYGSISSLSVTLRPESETTGEGAAAGAPDRSAGQGAARASRSAQPDRSAARIGADGLAGYVTQGYYAVYLSLQEPFVPGYGVANSVFLHRQVARLIGDASILERSYPERIEEKGWNAYGNWASIYPWIASDVTFPGTVVVILVIGWLLGRVWLDALGGRNPFAVALLGPLLVMVYYFPAHNKIMHSGEGVFGFGGLLLLWVAATWSRRSGGAATTPP